MKKPITIRDYRTGIRERQDEARRARKREMPNLAEADSLYDPKEGPAKIGDIGRAASSVAEPADEKAGGLSPDTIAGLRALKEHADQQRKQKQEEDVAEEQAETGAQGETGAEEPPNRAEETRVREQLRDVDDLALEQLMAGIERDVINNPTEKKAVEARLQEEGSELEVGDGLVQGYYTQTVPIARGLRVTYRSLSPYENRRIRALLFQWVDKDPTLEPSRGDLYGLMLIAASVTQINGNKLPEHMEGQDFYSARFDDELFTKKFETLNRYPSPLIHAIGVHGTWFDERVRRLFSAESLKNG